MRAVDTNVLVCAEIRTSRFYDAAYSVLRRLAEGDEPWAIPWPCAYEFLRVVTHPRVYHPPVPVEVARADLASVMASPSLLMLSETDRHAEIMDRVMVESGAAGNLVHDAHIAALCLEHGVSQLITGDRDFHRFGGIAIENPFAD